MKFCIKCNLKKLLTEFHKNKGMTDGRINKCKECNNEENNIRYYKNKKRYLQMQKDYVKTEEGYEAKKRAFQKYYEKNKAEVKKKAKEHTKWRIKNDPAFRVRCNIRSLLRGLFAQNGKGITKEATTRELVGCTWKELKIHIENQFIEEMTWKNYGLFGWHVDHIKPLSLFDLSDKIQLYEACHYSNLQPLWAKDNLSKGNKYAH